MAMELVVVDTALSPSHHFDGTRVPPRQNPQIWLYQANPAMTTKVLAHATTPRYTN